MPPTPKALGSQPTAAWTSGCRYQAARAGSVGRRRDERAVVGRVDEADAGEDHEQHDEQLDPDQHQVDPQRLLDADGDQGGQHGDQQHGQHVDAPPWPRLGPGDPDVAQEDDRVRAPALRDHAGAEHQLEQQVPADDPRDDLAEGGVGERVRRAGDRHGRGELRVAERGQSAGDGARSTKLSTIAGPASVLAARPVSVKMPAPMITPTPKTVRSSAVRRLLELVLRFVGVRDGLLDALGAHHAHLPLRSSGEST